MTDVRILLVEDEASLLTLLKRHLERAGYAVEACLSAEAALEVVGTATREPHLLIADETLPGISGTSLATKVLSRFPDTFCLLCSGYSLTLDGLPEGLRARAVILQKPYTPAALERAISEIIGKRALAVNRIAD